MQCLSDKEPDGAWAQGAVPWAGLASPAPGARPRPSSRVRPAGTAEQEGAVAGAHAGQGGPRLRSVEGGAG